MIQRNIVFDFSKSTGKLKPVTAVNGAPLITPSLDVDISDSFREMGVPFVRTHTHPTERVIDIHTVFPNPELCELFEGSFNFAPTDAYLRSIKDTGAEIFLRLGESPEPYEIKRYNRPRMTSEKFASVCERIIAHYNEGWGGGMKLGIKYVEILSSPDTPDGYLENPTEYYSLYRTVANRLRARFPRIKIGAYSANGFHSLNHYDATDTERKSIDFLEGFLEYITAKDTSAPLDFLSWKCRADTPEELSLHTNYARNFLNQAGLRKTQSIVSEFNLVTDSAPQLARDYPARLIASLILAQKSDLSMLFYSSANPETPDCALYSLEDRRRVHTYAPYRALTAFASLSKMKNTVLCTEDYRHTIYSLGATDGEKGAIILATCDYNGIIEITVGGAVFKTYSIRGIAGGGERGDGFSTSAEGIALVGDRIRVRAGKHEVYLITLE